jgi:hypothetical protein
MTERLAIHSTHEAAEKIAGIGAVLDGVLTDPVYQGMEPTYEGESPSGKPLHCFPQSLLVGPYHFPGKEGIFDRVDKRGRQIRRTFFDSASDDTGGGGLRHNTRKELGRIAKDFGTRIVFGDRLLGDMRTRVYVLLANPSGIWRSKVIDFCSAIKSEFGFDINKFEEYPAILSSVDRFLERIIKKDTNIISECDKPFQDLRGNWLSGGVPFIVEAGAGTSALARAEFPPIQSLDAFTDFFKANPYDIELEFYLYSAPPLWEAAKVLMSVEWRVKPDEVTLFSHDWLGVPLFWAMKVDRSQDWSKTRTVYFAHETRICRLIVEGILKDKLRDEVGRVCSPDGHDASFYKYLDGMGTINLEDAFPGTEGFKSIFYHQFNREAAKFDRRVAVGSNVIRETELILRGLPNARPPDTKLCPNGIPNVLDGVKEEKRLDAVMVARDRLKAFARKNFNNFEADWIFTSVNRCEISKSPWRNVEFFRRFAEANPDRRALFIWLSRPKPIPDPEDVEKWKKDFLWPKDHRPRRLKGDLRSEEEALWTAILDLNRQYTGRFLILYINQFGWSEDCLGDLDLAGTSFLDLRLGTDVELGLSVYEPFGIAPLEPFSAGAVCVLSDACGCAAHLERLWKDGKISDHGFVVGKFTQHPLPPADVSLEDLRNTIEPAVYDKIIRALRNKLDAHHRSVLLREAQAAMPHLSWKAAVSDHLLPAIS